MNQTQILARRVADSMEEIAVELQLRSRGFAEKGEAELARACERESEYWFGLAEKAREAV